MLRRLFWLICLPALLLVDVAPVCAQDVDKFPDWLSAAPKPFDPPSFPRGDGGYLSPVKIGLALVVFWLWLAMADWINRDAVQLKRKTARWNTIVCASFFLAFGLQWVIPWFAVSYTLLLIAAVGPPTAYVIARNRSQHEADKVFTRDHIQHVIRSKLGLSGERKNKKVQSQVKLAPRGTTGAQEDQIRLIASRQQNGQGSAELLTDRALQRRASAVMIDFTQEAAAVKFQIDGIWLDAEVQPRQLADPMLASLKALCGLKPEERRARQQGQFVVLNEAIKLKQPARLVSQGTRTGERVVLQFEDAQLRKRRLGDLGLRQKLQDDLLELFKSTKGLVVLAAPPGNGLTTLMSVTLNAIDRYTRTVMAIEEETTKDIEVENVPIVTYNGLEQETPQTKLPGVIRQFPDVMVVPDVTDAKTMATLCDEARGERLVITTVRAKDSIEGLLRPLTTKVPPKQYVMAVTAVVAYRLVRKLCETCREPYPPPAQILQRLGISADKVPAFYRPPTQPRPQPCPTCGGVGYHGQTALVELLTMTDGLRQQLFQKPNAETLRAAAKQAGLKTFDDEGLLLVVKGITSVQELARVLKEGTPQPAAAT